ncbi:M23 family metallopeptidase, partial [Nostocoides japonicum]|uniref:M23 family metallopeptidase n=1 Tax=Nostocoides japonicum TaxID=99481 RepID=UPI00138F96C8
RDVSATTAAEQLSDVTTVQQRRSAANARSAVLLARDQEAARAARAAERAALAKKRSAQRWVQPIHGGTFTSGYKMRWGRMHEGDDFSTPVGTPIRSMSTGTVIYTGWYGGGGNTTKIRYWDGTVSFFEHQSRITAKVGQRVAPGQLVGYSGNTGHSTGPHLHIEIHPHGGHSIDPLPWLHKQGLFTKQG